MKWDIPNRPITYDEFLQSPEIKQRVEVVDGMVTVFPTPPLRHQSVLSHVFMPVYEFVRRHDLGHLFFAPLDIIVQKKPLRVRQPNMMFISHARADIMKDRIYGGPDFVAEIVLPSHTRAYMESKLPDYASINVRECWILDLEARTVEFLEQEGRQWRQVYIRGEGERLESAVLSGLELDISDIFADRLFAGV